MIEPEQTDLTLGFIPLTDSAPLIVAKELGFFSQWGLNVSLQKQNSWATLRDKLHAGLLDATQMLAPMPLASSIGLGCPKVKGITPLVLS
jgi:NitT/TauT family transport system ATP-binding protein/nitrate/nitrite transport system substrate-binding protein